MNRASFHPKVFIALKKVDISGVEYHPATISQAEGMARQLGVDISEKERGLYCFLREATISVDDPEKGLLPQTMSDQAIMREIFLMTENFYAVKKLKEAYPFLKNN